VCGAEVTFQQTGHLTTGGVPTEELLQIEAEISVTHALDEILAGDSLTVVPIKVQIHAYPVQRVQSNNENQTNITLPT